MNEQLKNVEIEKLSTEEILEHRKNVLALESDEIVEYLKYAIDTFYKAEEDGDNLESVDIFFDSEDFKPYYDQIMKSEDETEA